MSKLIFIAASKCFQIDVGADNAQEEQEQVLACMLPFVTAFDNKGGIAVVDRYQRNTDGLRSKVHVLVKRVKQFNPRICRLADYFDKQLKPDEWFFIALDQEVSQEDCDNIVFKLKCIDASPKDMVKNFEVKALLSHIRSAYKVLTFTEQTKIRLGEPNKGKRVCRFCHRSMPEVTFKEVAHTISEALGNKTIITNDECDVCNHEFAVGIEQDFLSVFDVPRLLFGIHGKNGTPTKFVGNNYVIENVSDGRLAISYAKAEKEVVSEEHSFKFRFRPNRKFPPKHFYKALCKYALGVLDAETLSHFERTRRWLMGLSNEDRLPLVARIIGCRVRNHPRMMVFIRHDDKRTDLPHEVVYLQVVSSLFIYILPFSDKDICDFTREEDFDKFSTFYSSFLEFVKGWEFADYSSLQPQYPEIVADVRR